jgi:hypothetical protein
MIRDGPVEGHFMPKRDESYYARKQMPREQVRDFVKNVPPLFGTKTRYVIMLSASGPTQASEIAHALLEKRSGNAYRSFESLLNTGLIARKKVNRRCVVFYNNLGTPVTLVFLHALYPSGEAMATASCEIHSTGDDRHAGSSAGLLQRIRTRAAISSIPSHRCVPRDQPR